MFQKNIFFSILIFGTQFLMAGEVRLPFSIPRDHTVTAMSCQLGVKLFITSPDGKVCSCFLRDDTNQLTISTPSTAQPREPNLFASLVNPATNGRLRVLTDRVRNEINIDYVSPTGDFIVRGALPRGAFNPVGMFNNNAVALFVESENFLENKLLVYKTSGPGDPTPRCRHNNCFMSRNVSFRETIMDEAQKRKIHIQKMRFLDMVFAFNDSVVILFAIETDKGSIRALLRYNYIKHQAYFINSSTIRFCKLVALPKQAGFFCLSEDPVSDYMYIYSKDNEICVKQLESPCSGIGPILTVWVFLDKPFALYVYPNQVFKCPIPISLGSFEPSPGLPSLFHATGGEPPSKVSRGSSSRTACGSSGALDGGASAAADAPVRLTAEALALHEKRCSADRLLADVSAPVYLAVCNRICGGDNCPDVERSDASCMAQQGSEDVERGAELIQHDGI